MSKYNHFMMASAILMAGLISINSPVLAEDDPADLKSKIEETITGSEELSGNNVTLKGMNEENSTPNTILEGTNEENDAPDNAVNENAPQTENDLDNTEINNKPVENTETVEKSIYAELSGQYLTVVVNNSENYPSANAAVWSEMNGQDDLVWYPMTKNPDGTFVVAVNLGLHKSVGTFNIHVYSGNTYIDGESVYLDSYVSPSIEVLDNADAPGNVVISITDADGFSNVKVAVWGSDGGQNDLKWYDLADQGNGTFVAGADLSKHSEKGVFYFHAYGDLNGKSSFVDGCEYNYNGIPVLPPVVDASIDGQMLSVTVTNADAFSAANAAVWSDENGQDDLKWYEMTRDQDGNFTISVNLWQHGSTGKFNIHVYSGSQYLGGRDVDLESYAAPAMTVEKVEDSDSIVVITIENAFGFSDVRTAVWGKKDGQNDLKWYALTDNGDGTFALETDLFSHG